VPPISELPDLIGAFEETIVTEKNERRRLNGLVRVVEDYCAGVSDDFLGQFGESSQKYTRHLLHADAEDRFSLLALVWKPGQGTPIHDHPSWGVIGVLRGRMRFTNYAPSTEEGQNCLVRSGTVAGTAG